MGAEWPDAYKEVNTIDGWYRIPIRQNRLEPIDDYEDEHYLWWLEVSFRFEEIMMRVREATVTGRIRRRFGW